MVCRRRAWRARTDRRTRLAGNASLQEQSTAGPASGKRTIANDLVWRVPFRHRSEDDGESAWLHLVLMIEVQGDVDHLKALRIRNYVDNHHMELWRGRRFGAGDRPAPVLPIVIYPGATRWTAARRVIGLVTPTSSTVAEPEMSSRTNDLFAGDGYLTLDTLRVAADDLRHDNAASFAGGALQSDAATHPGAGGGRRGRGSMRQHSGNFLEIVLLWAQQMAQRLIGLDLGIDDMAKLDRLHESGELEATSRRAVGPIRNGTVPRVWRRASNEASSKASNEAWNEASPQSGTCCAGKRIASSTPARRRGLQASWPTSATPKVWRGRAT